MFKVSVIIRFIIYGTIGWCLEILWTGLSSFVTGDVRLTGTTYLWMFPLYGMAIFFEPVHEKLRHLKWFYRGLIWMLVFFTLEYLSGLIIRAIVGICPWDYYEAKLNIHGLIRLDYAPLWFFLGLFFEKVHDLIKKLKFKVK